MEGSAETPRGLLERLGGAERPEAPLAARTARVAAAALATDDALDHLSKLYTLMDQLFALKERNSDLGRRARHIEHLDKLKRMRDQIENEMRKSLATDPDEFFGCEATSMDIGAEFEYTEALLESMLAAGHDVGFKRSKRKGERSRSMGGEESTLRPETSAVGRRASDCNKAKISKWTRVKAAFKWERAHAGVAAPPIRLPSSGSPSPASSAEDVSSQNDACGKSHRTPWGKMKGIIQTRKDSVRLSHSESAETLAGTKRSPPTLTVTMPSSEELAGDRPPPSRGSARRRALAKHKSLDTTKRVRSHDSSDPDSGSPSVRRHDSKWKKVKKAFLTTPASTPSSPSRRSAYFSYEPEDIALAQNATDEIKRDYQALQTRLNGEFHTRASSSSPSGNRSPNRTSNGDEGTFSDSKGKRIGSTGGSIASVPTNAQLSDDFRKKLEEWKRLKATNSVPSYTGEDHDDKSKTKKKEVLVQTGVGFFRFEGISRSFTRKLHEWEKSRGIAPEASTSALLRESLVRPSLPMPRKIGFEQSSFNQKGERRLQRSHSAGSVREENPTRVSTSVSSLSLNNLEECNDRVSDYGEEESFDTYTEGKVLASETDSDGGPGAVLVEIEDEIEETAAPLVACSPLVHPQTPVYRYPQAQERHLACENTQGKVSSPRPCLQKVSDLESSILSLIRKEEVLDRLLSGKRNVSDRCDDVSKKIDAIKGQTSKTSSELSNIQRRLERLKKEEDILQNSLKDRVRSFDSLFGEFRSNVFNLRAFIHSEHAEDLQQKVLRLSEVNAARTETINSGKSYDTTMLTDLTNVSQVISGIRNECIKRDSNNNNDGDDNDNIGTLCVSYVLASPCTLKLEQDIPSDDSSKGAIKKVRDPSRKKTKVRQRFDKDKSAPSESDSEKEADALPKRKRPQKSRSLEGRLVRSLDGMSNTDSGDNVFILRLEPKTPETENETSRSVFVPSQLSISIPPEGMEPRTEESEPDVFVKTTRKIFSPVRGDGDGGGEARAVIGFDLEELANSIKSGKENEESKRSPKRIGPHHVNSSSGNGSEESLNRCRDARRGLPGACKGSPTLSRASTPGIVSLPPLPASPPTSRRDKPQKETAPSIRIMIQKYNMRLNEEDTKSQSGGSTPPWRSPRSRERFQHELRRPLRQAVRNNPFLDREVQKSASTSQIMKNQFSTTTTGDHTSTPPLSRKLPPRGILKSSSAGSLKSPTSSVQRAEVIRPVQVPTQKIEVGEKRETIQGRIYGKKIDSDLLRSVESKPVEPIVTEVQALDPPDESCRAMKIKRAKEQFLASGSQSVETRDGSSSNVDLTQNRLSRVSFNSDVSCDDTSSTTATDPLVKSASVGTIHARKADDSRSGGRFGLSSLASKLKKVRIRGKPRQDEKMDTVTKLCRQSLLVDLQGDSAPNNT